jgi:hypothetical protein
MLPRDIFKMKAFRFEPKIANSGAPRKCSVDFVSGTEIRRTSISWLRKLWRDALSVPLYHALGRVPSGSPVPGTM